jgi:hypothetical protein
MEIKKFENSLIAFDFESDMINATDMLKAFPEKKMNNFLRTKQTKDFIDVLQNNTLKSVIQVKTGNTGGTWMNKLLAYKFAAWLDPKFELFVYFTFDRFMKEKFESQQRQLDYFWDKEDINDIYKKK